MRNLIASIAALACMAVPAFSADLATVKETTLAPTPPSMWSGLYLGLNAGGTWSNNNGISTIGLPGSAGEFLGSAAINSTLAILSNDYLYGSSNGGFIGGGQVGYNYQFSENIVASLEADIQGIASSSNQQNSIKSLPVGEFNETYSAIATGRQNLEYLGTVRGRLGWLINPNILVFGTGGLAYGGVSLNTSFMAQESLGPDVFPPVFGGVNYSSTRTGWTAGGGFEWMFAPNWSTKVEYLYYDLGTFTSNGFLAQLNGGELWGSALTQTSTRFSGSIVRAGVNYHLNWDTITPVLAKY